MGRALEVLAEYQELIKAHECRQVRCVATSAFREASNRDILMQRVKQAVGYDIMELSGEDEAALVLLAVQHDFPNPGGRRVIVDVGGGSTEFIMEQAGQLKSIHSLPMGSVRMTERHIRHDPPKGEELEALALDIREILSRSRLTESADAMVAVGGTATTFVAMELQLAEYDPQQVHGSVLSEKALQQILDRCAELPYQERVNLPGLHSGRAEVIVAGGLILQAAMEHFKQTQCLVSDRGLRWGVILDQTASET